MISIQQDDFSHAHEYEQLRTLARSDGAIVTFTGLVRDFNENASVVAIELEHYPDMTERALLAICDEAREKWQLGAIRVIHRIGKIGADEQIVFVGVSARHRKGAFEACQFIMDFLKTKVPLWKKEVSPNNSTWVAAKQSDNAASEKWISK